MNNFKRNNTILGIFTFIVAFVVYALTAEPTASFWDCGEFIAASYKLQVVHPPGAPFFLLLGNLFSNFAFGDVSKVAFMVNLLSAFTSALCVMFTCWTITHFAEKLSKTMNTEETGRQVLILGAGLIGALALTFSDTFWFSAVEAEVYASSSFFTAFTFWCILKWEHNSEKVGADKWLIFIAYLIGVAIGVHLLNLLVIPAIVYVYYFKNREFTKKGFLVSSLIGIAILGFVQVGIIPGLPGLAAKFDLFFVNNLGMGFGSGVMFFAALLIAVVVGGLIWSAKKQKAWINTAILCFAFVIIGYSSYAMVVVRSLADPPIDMNNPEEPFNFVSYINREQYGDRPLLQGPYYNAPSIDYEKESARYRKEEDGYKIAGYNYDVKYKKEYLTIFPRMGDMQKSSSPSGYQFWSGAPKDQPPKFSHNLKFFFNYQLGHMYWRYFLWNFAGRQSDLQGDGDQVNGNWISGIKPLDAVRLGPQSNLPDFMANNKGRNTYFMLPLILGLAGLIYQFQKKKIDFLVMMALFLFTGILIAVYLNAPPYEPRERDYTLVGSFQIFCIWIGLGVMQIAEWLSKYMKLKTAGFVATGISLLAVPTLLAAENWDDHNRSGRNVVLDFAKNYLETCDSNAILFTNGDNDTYPLWYAQSVEGIRTDVRVVNLQLLNFEWCVEQLTQEVYDSKPFQLSVSKEKYDKGIREQLYYYSNTGINVNPDDYYPLQDVISFITNDDNPQTKVTLQSNEKVNFLPVKNFSLAVDNRLIADNGTVPEEDSAYVVDQMRFSLTGNAILKADWVVLDLIAQNAFKRPIYFSSNSVEPNYLGLGKYFRLDGLAYRLVPLEKPQDQLLQVNINPDVLYDRLVNRYNLGDMDNPDILLDEQCVRMARTFRNYFGMLGVYLSAKGHADSAVKAVDKVISEIPAWAVQYEMIEVLRPLAQTYYVAGQKEKASALVRDFVEAEKQKLEYYGQYDRRQFPQINAYYMAAFKNMEGAKEVAERFGDADLKEHIQQILNKQK